ncbi:MAG: pitrilysin family protein [Rhodospirillales bacterium]
MSVRVTELAGGMRVVSDAMETVETASVGVWVEAGTRHEHPSINGVSHILEHMAFKGTKRRSARAIAEEIEAVGGHINAYTSRENTAYFAKVLKEDLELAIDIIADILQNSVMDDDELALERAVIIQEINQAQDTPEDVVFDLFQDAAFPGQALGRPVLGTAELVAGMNRETIIKFMQGNYSAPKMVLAAAGRVDHDRLVAIAEEAFTSLPEHTETPFDAASYTGGEARQERDLEQAHLLFGFEGMAYKDPDFYALSVWSTLFGGGMSSRLFQEVREKRGLAYAIYSFISCYADGGVFGIYAGTGEKELPELISVLGGEIRKAGEAIGEDEVSRARAQLRASILMSQESTSSRCEQLARQMIVFKRPLPVGEIIGKIEKVDVGAVQKVAARITGSAPTFAALGPISSLGELKDIRKPA